MRCVFFGGAAWPMCPINAGGVCSVVNGKYIPDLILVHSCLCRSGISPPTTRGQCGIFFCSAGCDVLPFTYLRRCNKIKGIIPEAVMTNAERQSSWSKLSFWLEKRQRGSGGKKRSAHQGLVQDVGPIKVFLRPWSSCFRIAGCRVWPMVWPWTRKPAVSSQMSKISSCNKSQMWHRHQQIWSRPSTPDTSLHLVWRKCNLQSWGWLYWTRVTLIRNAERCDVAARTAQRLKALALPPPVGTKGRANTLPAAVVKELPESQRSRCVCVCVERKHRALTSDFSCYTLNRCPIFCSYEKTRIVQMFVVQQSFSEWHEEFE